MCIYSYVYVYIWMNIYICMYVCVCVCYEREREWVSVWCVCVCVCVFLLTFTYIGKYIFIRVFVYIHICINIIYTYMCVCVCANFYIQNTYMFVCIYWVCIYSDNTSNYYDLDERKLEFILVELWNEKKAKNFFFQNLLQFIFGMAWKDFSSIIHDSIFVLWVFGSQWPVL